MKKGNKRRNRLNKEHSPYLLQHATNPVDWFPWCDEAFERAHRESKPIFLSIGYATCHWCHVMAHESFDDEEVAALLNRTFVCVKVDREERPDLDHLYMSVCQLMTGTGGWPLTLILTPDKKPFFAATYIPRDTRYGKKGLRDLIGEIARAWRERQDTIQQTTNQVQIALEHISHADSDRSLSQDAVASLYRALREGYDEQHGGFGPAPKFPSPHLCMFLFRYWHVHGDVNALRMAERTLEKIGDGGIHDHVGGGFHRYAIDAQWRVPHFEKMLYDQALLMIAYAEAYQITRNDAYRREVLGLADYVQSELIDPDGGFISAEDADSEGKEGAFYLWSYDEVRKILKRAAPVFCKAFGILPEGNIANESTPEPVGRNVLYRTRTRQNLAQEFDISVDALDTKIEQALHKLRQARQARIPPVKDEKILTDWNGLMIAALARSGRIIGNRLLISAACRAVDFIRKRLHTGNDVLMHRYYRGKTGIKAYLDDYAYVLWGLIECYYATFQASYLEHALTLCDAMIAAFWDPGSHGGFFFTSTDSERLLVRQKIQYDGALPSGSSVAYHVLCELGAITGTDKYVSYIEQLEHFMAYQIPRNPSAYAFFIGSYLRNYATPALITIAGDPDDSSMAALLSSLHSRFLPYATMRLYPAGTNDPILMRIMPGPEMPHANHHRSIARVCTNRQCYEATTDPAVMFKQLNARTLVLDFDDQMDILGSGDLFSP